MAPGSIEFLDSKTLFELEMVMETTSAAEFEKVLNLEHPALRRLHGLYPDS